MNEDLKELKDIKKLLILLLMQNGVGQDKIAKALGLKDQSAVSHLINPKGKSEVEAEQSVEKVKQVE